MPLNLKNPHVMKADPETGQLSIDDEASDPYVLLETLGKPRVFYKPKENKYYKGEKEDPKTGMTVSVEFSDKEITDMGLATPVQIKQSRDRMIREAVEAGKVPNMKHILAVTSPNKIEPPASIQERLVSISAEDRLINRLNRATLGK